MVEPPSLDALDIAAFGSAGGLLVVGYVIYPNHILQYGIWLAIFIIWMAWFVYYGTKWIYDIESRTDEESSTG